VKLNCAADTHEPEQGDSQHQPEPFDTSRIGHVRLLPVQATPFQVFKASFNPSTQGISLGMNPIWSNNGYLVFQSSPDGNSEVYMWDGSSIIPLTYTPASPEYYASLWTP
jgi:hypothetical protein